MNITDEMIVRLADEAGWPVWMENSHRAFREGDRAALAVQPAEPLALPPLPEDLGSAHPQAPIWPYVLEWHYASQGADAGRAADRLDSQLRAALTAYARACAAAWGVTLADTGD